MHFLSIEPSTQVLGLAVSKDAEILTARNLKANQLMEKTIITSIDRVLDSAGIGMNDLNGFVIGIGPGSFTSLRIGLATIKAFVMATGKPVVGIGSLDVIAAGAAHIPCDEICVLVDARRDLVYSNLYRKQDGHLKAHGQYSLSPLPDVLDRVNGNTLFVGNGAGLYRRQIEQAYASSPKGCRGQFAPEKLWLPSAKVLAVLGYERLKAKMYNDPIALLPMYLYAQDCQVSLANKK